MWGRPTPTATLLDYDLVRSLESSGPQLTSKTKGDWPALYRRFLKSPNFVGWYNRLSHERLGIPFSSPRQLYLAYHEGRGGYARRSFEQKPAITGLASRVRNRAFRYDHQLKTCEQEFQCWRWYQFWPFCQS